MPLRFLAEVRIPADIPGKTKNLYNFLKKFIYFLKILDKFIESL